MRAEQGNLMDRIVKETDIKCPKAELEQLKIDGANMESNLQYLKVDLEQQKKGVADQEVNIQQLKAELELQKKDGADKEADIILLREDIQSVKSELELQKKDGADKEADIILLREYIQSVKSELELQKKDGGDKESDIQHIRAEQEHQKKDEADMEANIKLLRADIESVKAELELKKKDGVDKESEIQQLKAELEKQKKYEVENQSLQVDVERQRKLIDGLVNPYNCTMAKVNGINEILISNFSSQPFKVVCDAFTRGGGWSVILKRMDGSVNFYRNWTEYKNGFGDLDGEFFLGLDKIHALTAERKQELLVVLEDFEGEERFETYDSFAIGNEDQQYELHTLGKANGTAGDSLSYHRGKKFSTYDRDNDKHPKNCAMDHNSAWWYGAYHDSQLTGNYGVNNFGKGVNWVSFRGRSYSLKRAVMMIRPSN
ncbi:angiopoietin-related protein 7-like [Drosophila innubila]|uniref:angiopoietin-related protein 7-like n=1 Tax=Drosophila innubila TaxID=198719 RepID=UPI00148C1788|nr:angiopoietin-related protein 7-like [Drosophila innubila]